MIEKLHVVNDSKNANIISVYTPREKLFSKGKEENPANTKLLSGASTGAFSSEVKPIFIYFYYSGYAFFIMFWTKTQTASHVQL